MKPMLPSLTFEVPKGSDWFFEVKYDGFRTILEWDENGIKLISRNEKALTSQFPEINEFLLKYEQQFQPFLPLIFDGELVYLENPYKANFSAIQMRGRLKAKTKIYDQARLSPCRMMVFDVLTVAGKSQQSLPYQKRKRILADLFSRINWSLKPDHNHEQLLQFIPAYRSFSELWDKIVIHDGEGTVAKRKNSLWEEGKRTSQWLKYKNWKFVCCFITSVDKINGYFYVGVYKENGVHVIGHVLFGFKPEEKQALKQVVAKNKVIEDERFLYVDPAICLEIKYLELYENELREPHFHRFRLDLVPKDCTFDRFLSQRQNLPPLLQITHPDKILWPPLEIRKADYIHYLREIAPYIMPFLKDRLLTTIRFPHGMYGEPFYQKNCPDYAPEYVETYMEDAIAYILCNNMETLLWLGNQLALEFHIPFQTYKNKGPAEIVFDLDPPSADDFFLAVRAARLIKEVLDQLNLVGFIKTSGNKGLQIYLPLPDDTFSYDDTRLFTSFVADYLIVRDPESFTIERMKKNRGGRLYIDYLQHSEGKTIIAPYSLRGNKFAGCATPLFWDEIDEKLNPNMFTMQNTLSRLKKQINPFNHYFCTKQMQSFDNVLKFLKAQKKAFPTKKSTPPE